MWTSLRWMSLVIALVVAGCHTPDPVYPPVDRDAFEHEWRDFERAYDELLLSTKSTPNWVIDPASYTKVKGQAAHALRELEQLRPFSVEQQISIGTIELAALHVKDLARTDGETRKEFKSGPMPMPQPYPEDAMRYASEELAYYETVRRLDWLELYVKDNIPNPWLESRVMVNVRENGRRVLGVNPDTRIYWCSNLTHHSHYEFERNRQRIRPALDALELTAVAR